MSMKTKDDGGLPYDNPKYKGKSYLEILYMAREMENSAIEVALALDQIAPEEDRKKFIEIANDENDHDRIYAEIIEREEQGKTPDLFKDIAGAFSVQDSKYSALINKKGVKSGSEFRDTVEANSRQEALNKLIKKYPKSGYEIRDLHED